MRDTHGLKNKLLVPIMGPGWDVGKPRLGYLHEIPEVRIYSINHVTNQFAIHPDPTSSSSMGSSNELVRKDLCSSSFSTRGHFLPWTLIKEWTIESSCCHWRSYCSTVFTVLHGIHTWTKMVCTNHRMYSMPSLFCNWTNFMASRGINWSIRRSSWMDPVHIEKFLPCLCHDLWPYILGTNFKSCQNVTQES